MWPVIAPLASTAAATSFPSIISLPEITLVPCATANGDMPHRMASSTTIRQSPGLSSRCFGMVRARDMNSARRRASSMLRGTRPVPGLNEAVSVVVSAWLMSSSVACLRSSRRGSRPASSLGWPNTCHVRAPGLVRNSQRHISYAELVLFRGSSRNGVGWPRVGKLSICGRQRCFFYRRIRALAGNASWMPETDCATCLWRLHHLSCRLASPRTGDLNLHTSGCRTNGTPAGPRQSGQSKL